MRSNFWLKSLLLAGVISISLLITILCLGMIGVSTVYAYENEEYLTKNDEVEISTTSYILDDNTGYYETDGKKVTSSEHPLGKNLINLSLYTNSDFSQSVIDEGTIYGYQGYGITGNCAQIKLSYNFGNSEVLKKGKTENGREYTLAISNDTYQSVGKFTNIGVVGTGAMLFQKKTDANGAWEWQNKDGDTKKQLHTFSFTDTVSLEDYSGGEKYVLYTPAGEDLNRGVFVKITFAYELKYTEYWNEKVLWWDKAKSETKYINIIETAEFYLVQNSGRVLFHNASNFDKIGEEDSSGAVSINDFETLLDGDVTLNGFRLDTCGVEAYDILYRFNFGEEQAAENGQFFLNHGRYDFTVKRKIGDAIHYTLFIDRREVNDAVVGYFGQGLFTSDSQRVYTTGEYPAYLVGHAKINLNATDGTVAPVVGQLLKKEDNGDYQHVKDLTQEYDSIYKTKGKQVSINEVGTYKAEFWGNPKYLNDCELSGDLFHFVFNFEIVDENTPKEPSINQAYLEGLIGFSDLQSKYYSVSLKTAGTGNAIFAFSDYSGAYDFAYSIERSKVNNIEGKYEYREIIYNTQHEVLAAIDEAAKSQVVARFFDATNPESYQTADIVDDNVLNLNFTKDVIVFANDSEQSYMQAGLPSLNGRKFRYVSPETGIVEEGVLQFAFIHVAGFESETVTLTSKDGKYIYDDILYDVSVEYQLGLKNAPSGIYTVTERNSFNYETEYEAVYIRPGDMTGEITVGLFKNGEVEDKKFNLKNATTVSNLNGFILKSAQNELDPYSIVKVSHNGAIDIFAFDEINDLYFADGGVYEIAIVDRLGNTVSFTLIISAPVGLSNVWLELEQDDDTITKQFIAFVGQEIELPLPTLTSELYIFDGWLYDDNLITDFKLRPTASGTQYVWQQITQKYTYLNFNSEGGETVERIKAEIGKPIQLPTTTKDNWAFGGWQYSGNTYMDKFTPTTSSPTFVAVWNYKETKIELYDGNIYHSITAKVGEKVMLPFPTRTGYTFFGWREELGDGSNKVYYGQITSLANIEELRLDALWIRESDVSFDKLSGGTGGRTMLHFVDGDLLANDSLQSTVGTSISTPRPTRAGYVFIGWVWRTTPVSGKIYTGDTMAVPSNSDGKVVVEALWIAKSTGNTQGTIAGTLGGSSAGSTSSGIDNGIGILPGKTVSAVTISSAICLLALCSIAVLKRKGVFKSVKLSLKTMGEHNSKFGAVELQTANAVANSSQEIESKPTYASTSIKRTKRNKSVHCVKFGLATVCTAILLAVVFTFIGVFSSWPCGAFKALAEEKRPATIASVQNDVLLYNTSDKLGGDWENENNPTKEEVVEQFSSIESKFKSIELDEDEKFIISLVLLDFIGMGYDVFPAELNLSENTNILGIAYTDYSGAYNEENTSKNSICFDAGFVAFPHQKCIQEQEINNGLFIKDLMSPIVNESKNGEEWQYKYLLTFTENYPSQHFVFNNNYFIYNVSGTEINFEILEPSEELFNANKDCGSVYSYDDEKIIYDPNLGKEFSVEATSLNTLLDPVIAKNEYNHYIAEQTANGFTVDTMNFVYISYEALDAYYLSNQDETLLGIDVQEFYDMEQTVGANEYYTVDADGNLTKLEFPPKAEDKASWLDRLAGAVLSIGMICVGVIIVAAVSVISCGAASAAAPYIMGAFIGAGMEVFMQTVIQGKKLEDINWLRVGIAAVSGVLSAIPGVGWFGAGLIQGVTEAAMTAVDGGSLEDVLKSFTVGFVTGVAIHGIGKALSKVKFCFAAGTAVLMASGLSKPIEDIKVGDVIRSYNEKSGIFENKRVLQKFVNSTKELCHVVLANGETILSTPNHTFFANGEWLPAYRLKAGDTLLDCDGKSVEIQQISYESLKNAVPVYNFTVESNSTYIVGDSNIVVHNSCAHQKAEWRKFRKDFWRSEATNQSYKNLYNLTDDNLRRMGLGKAPFGFDGWPLELHHIDGIANNFTNVIPMSRSQHILQHMYQRIFGGIL